MQQVNSINFKQLTQRDDPTVRFFSSVDVFGIVNSVQFIHSQLQFDLHDVRAHKVYRKCRLTASLFIFLFI